MAIDMSVPFSRWRSAWIRLEALADRPLAFALLALMIVLPLVAGHKQELTGDEPRYLLYAIAFIRHGHFLMALPEWSVISQHVGVAASGQLPVGLNGSVLMNPVYLPGLLSPIAGLLSLRGLRLASLTVGILGLLALWRLLRRVANPLPALAAVSITGLSIPLLPYLHIFYMEAFLFAAVAWSWLRLQDRERGLSGDLLTAFILLAIPFIHLRGAMVAVLLFLGLLHASYRRDLRARTALLVGLALAAAGLLVALNLILYGAVTGSVNSARPPKPWDWFPVLSMQLFNVHHGLLAYAPIWALGYAGLCYGAWRGIALARQGLVLALVAAVTGVGVNPGECWPARFWVLSLPMLSVGLCVWLARVRGRVAGAVAAMLLLITIVNTAIFIQAPNDFIENRQASTTYAHLFERWGILDFNTVLPVEIVDQRNRNAARDFAVGTGLFIGFMALSLRRSYFAWPALLLLMLLFDCARVQQVRQGISSIAATPRYLHLELAQTVSLPILRVGHQNRRWFEPASWMEVTATGADGQSRQILAADPIILVSCRSGVRGIEIRADTVDLKAEAEYGLELDRSASLIRTLLPRDAC